MLQKKNGARNAGLVLLSAVWLASSMAEAKDVTIWMTLPAVGVDSLHDCHDSIPGPPIHHLEWLRIKGWCFNPARCDTFNSSAGIDGMEGDSLGVVLDLPPGSHGQLRLRTVNPVGESCDSWLVFAVPL